mmetsp:Transcript_130297/g.337926  ORF Transcript_130297/g.337926 Transcript_130297/m.337926 type:complete len:232 (-) Transcript_130297:192-887(-)
MCRSEPAPGTPSIPWFSTRGSRPQHSSQRRFQAPTRSQQSWWAPEWPSTPHTTASPARSRWMVSQQPCPPNCPANGAAYRRSCAGRRTLLSPPQAGTPRQHPTAQRLRPGVKSATAAASAQAATLRRTAPETPCELERGHAAKTRSCACGRSYATSHMRRLARVGRHPTASVWPQLARKKLCWPEKQRASRRSPAKAKGCSTRPPPGVEVSTSSVPSPPATPLGAALPDAT